MAAAPPMALAPTRTLAHLQAAAQERWLLPEEVVDILTNCEALGCRLSDAPPDCPPASSVFIFDRRVCKRFRRDGHNWLARRTGGRVREDHVSGRAGTFSEYVWS